MSHPNGPSDAGFFYETLVQSYVESPGFVDRQWLTDRIEASLAHEDCRFVLLTGEPGAGKTALVASLARRHADWPRFFIRRDSQTPLSRGDARSFLFAVGHQLAALRPALFRPETLQVVVKQMIDEVAAGGRVRGIEVQDLYVSPFYKTALMVEQHAKVVAGELEGLYIHKVVIEPRFLEIGNLEQMAVIAPCRALLAEDPAARIVVLIDALDELRYQRGDDDILSWLCNSPQLPANLRFVLSSREDESLQLLRHRQRRWLRDEAIDGSSALVQEDLLRYSRHMMSQDAVRMALVERGENPDDAAARAVAKADGNFQYLAALSRAIQQAVAPLDAARLSSLLRLESVPAGLEELYAFFLMQMKVGAADEVMEVACDTPFRIRHIPAWEGLYQPVLGVLAVAREPLGTRQIQHFATIKAEDRWMSAGLARLRQFLDHEDGCYRLYHATFAEFLTSPATKEKHRACYLDPAEWHRKITMHYRGTADAWEAVDWRRTDDYGLSHLSAHLYALSDAPAFRHELYALICRPFMDGKRARTITYRGFADDVELAVALAGTEEPPNLVQEIRGSFLCATLASLTTNVPPEALGVLAQTSRTAEALASAAMMQDRSSQNSAYVLIANALLDRDDAQEAKAVLRLALVVLDKFEDKVEKAVALRALITPLVRARETSGLERALAMIGDEPAGVSTLRVLVGGLVTGNALGSAMHLVGQSLACAQTVEDATTKVSMLVAVVDAYVETGDTEQTIQTATEALRLARALNNPEDKAEALCGLGMALARSSEQHQRAADVVREALTVAETIDQPSQKAHALSSLIDVLARLGNHDGLLRILPVAEMTPDEAWKAGLLTDLARVLVPCADESLRKRISAAAETMVDATNNGRVLSAIATAMAKMGDFDRALRMVDTIADGEAKSEASRDVACVLAHAADFDRALAVTDVISHAEWKASALSGVASALVAVGQMERAADIATRALTVADEIRTSWGEFHGSLKILEAIGSERVKTVALVEVGRALAAERRFDEALALAITSDEQVEALTILVNALAEAGEPRDLNRAFAILEEYDLAAARTGVMSRAARVAIKSGDEARASQRLYQAIDALDGIESRSSKADALNEMADIIGQLRDVVAFDRAVALAETIGDDLIKGMTMANLAQAADTAVGGKRALDVSIRALALVDPIPVEKDAEHKFRVVGYDDPLPEDMPRTPGNKAVVLSMVSQGLAAAGELEGATDVAHKARDLTDIITDAKARPIALAAVAQAFARLENDVSFERVVAATEAIVEKVIAARALTTIAKALVEANMRAKALAVADRALAFADALADEAGKAEALSRTAEVFGELGEHEKALQLVRRAFAAARLGDRASVFNVLTHGSAVLGHVDSGETLLRVYNALTEVDRWWNSEAR